MLGLEQYLTITDLQTASHAIQEMLLPTITQGNVPLAITPMAGQVPSSIIQALLIVYLAILEMHHPTITLDSVPTAIIQMLGLGRFLTIMVLRIAFRAIQETLLPTITQGNALIVITQMAGRVLSLITQA
jgi:hypothetical protein